MHAWNMPAHPQHPLGDATAFGTANATHGLWATPPVEPCHNGKKTNMFEQSFLQVLHHFYCVSFHYVKKNI